MLLKKGMWPPEVRSEGLSLKRGGARSRNTPKALKEGGGVGRKKEERQERKKNPSCVKEGFIFISYIKVKIIMISLSAI